MESKRIIISLGSSISDQEHYRKLARECNFRLKRFSAKTNIYVCTSVLDYNYRACVSLGIHIVRPLFLEYVAGFGSSYVYNNDDIIKSRLPRFAGTRICCVNIQPEIRRFMENVIETYGGCVTEYVDEATHVVVPKGETYAGHEDQYVVSDDWINESANLGACANEKLFDACAKQKLQRHEAIKRKSCESTKNLYSSIRRLAQKKSHTSDFKYKRFGQTLELYKCEVETLRKLDVLLRVKKMNFFLPNEQNESVFAYFELLHTLHSRIVEKLAKVYNTFSDESVIGSIFIEEAPLIEAAYRPYLFGLQHSRNLLKDLCEKNQKFKNYLSSCESNKAYKLEKTRIADLFSAPYQELTNKINVLLKEILKNTSEDMPDFSMLQQAVKCIENILEKVNDLKRANADAEALYQTIADIPHTIICSPRTFVCRVAAESVGGKGKFGELGKAAMHLFMFNDVLTICTPIEKSISCINLSAKDHSIDIVKYKHYCSIELIHFRAALRIIASDYAPTYVFTIRTEVSDTEWAIRGYQLDDFIFRLIDQIKLISNNRDFAIDTKRFTDTEELKRSNLQQLSYIPGLNSTLGNENSPIVKLRTYSKRLTGRKWRGKSLPRHVQILQEDLPKQVSVTPRPKSEICAEGFLPDGISQDQYMLPLNESMCTAELEPIERDERLVY